MEVAWVAVTGVFNPQPLTFAIEMLFWEGM